jgi:hypothetical protein
MASIFHWDGCLVQHLADCIKAQGLKSGKCRDLDGLVRELFKEGVIGEPGRIKTFVIIYSS